MLRRGALRAHFPFLMRAVDSRFVMSVPAPISQSLCWTFSVAGSDRRPIGLCRDFYTSFIAVWHFLSATVAVSSSRLSFTSRLTSEWSFAVLCFFFPRVAQALSDRRLHFLPPTPGLHDLFPDRFVCASPTAQASLPMTPLNPRFFARVF